MKKSLIAIAISLVLVACGGPKDTVLPQDLGKMDAVKPSMEKLTTEEQRLVTAYIMRHTIGAELGSLFGGKKGPGIPEGMTIGKAIDEQSKFESNAAIEEAKQKALRDKLKAEQEEAQRKMREVVTVTLVSKKAVIERGYSGIVIDEQLQVTFGYKNNTDKNISGVKGTITVVDLFGDEISSFSVSNDSTIKANQSITWTGSRSLKFSFGTNKDRKLAELNEDKYKVLWLPESIIFEDGTTLIVPKN